MRLGYTDVIRYPGGVYAWKEEYPTRLDGDVDTPRVLAVGDNFPDCRLAVLNGEQDREYLGLPAGTRWLDLSELGAQFVLIQLYNTMCNECVSETKMLTRFFKRVQADPVLRDHLKIIGLGVYDSNRAVVRFRKHYDVLYPLFSDKHGQIFECLGQASLPLAYLVSSNGDGTWRIEMIKRGYFEPDEKFLRTLRQTVSRDEQTD